VPPLPPAAPMVTVVVVNPPVMRLRPHAPAVPPPPAAERLNHGIIGAGGGRVGARGGENLHVDQPAGSIR
jgi:hypothetical protein